MRKSIFVLFLCLLAVLPAMAQKSATTRFYPVATQMDGYGRYQYQDFAARDLALAGDPGVVSITKQVVNDYQCIPNPGNPPTGNVRVYCDSSTGQFTCLTSTGASCVSSGVSQSVSPLAYGAVFNVKFCAGNAATMSVTSGQNTLQCSTATFTSADVGKRVKLTDGCCDSSIGPSTTGVSIIPANTTIASITDSTHIHMSANATNSCTNNCWLAYGTDDTAALQAAQAAVAALNQCGTLVLPMGASFTTTAQFNSISAGCVSSIPSNDLTGATIYGEGSSSSLLVPLDFDFSTCSVNITCFFAGYAQAHDLGIFGLNDSMAGGTAHDVYLARGAYQGNSAGLYGWHDIALIDWDGGDAGENQNIGFYLTGSASRIYVQGFGAQSCALAGGYLARFRDSLCGNGSWSSLTMSGIVTTSGLILGQVGSSQSTVHCTNGTVWYSDSDYLFNPATGSGQGVQIDSGCTAYLTKLNDTYGGSGSNNGLYVNGGTVYLRDSLVVGATSGNSIYRASGTWYDLGGNTFGSSINANAFPSCTFSTGGGTTPSCSVQSGSTNEKGVIIATTGTGSPGSTGTVTLTFAGSFAGASGAAPACQFSIDNSGTAWGAEAVTPTNTQSSTAPVVAWTNVASLVATALATSSPYRIGYNCVPR